MIFDPTHSGHVRSPSSHSGGGGFCFARSKILILAICDGRKVTDGVGGVVDAVPGGKEVKGTTEGFIPDSLKFW